MRSRHVAAVAGTLLVLGCFTRVTDASHWQIPDGEFDRFLADSDACEYQATPQLQPELPQQVDPETYRRCMQGMGWRRR